MRPRFLCAVIHLAYPGSPGGPVDRCALQRLGEITDKHDTYVVFRAVENRVAMVKADGGYVLPL
jgi:hypothetical protein